MLTALLDGTHGGKVGDSINLVGVSPAFSWEPTPIAHVATSSLT